MTYKSERPYKMVGSGPESAYPRITFPRDLAPLIGTSYMVEVAESGKITLLPMVVKK